MSLNIEAMSCRQFAPARFSLSIIVLCLSVVGHAQPLCRPVEILEPLPGATITEIRPTVRWRPVAGATSYRITIRSRVPEGAVLFVADTNVSASEFLPPKPLASGIAVVTLSVSPVCAGAEAIPSVAATEHRFYIDARSTCRLSAPPTVESGADGMRLVWPRLATADRYEVFAYLIADGATLFARETRDNVLPIEGKRATYVVRPRCGPVTGAEMYLDKRKDFMKGCLAGKDSPAPAAKSTQQDKMAKCNKDASAKALEGDEFMFEGLGRAEAFREEGNTEATRDAFLSYASEDREFARPDRHINAGTA